MLLSLLLRWVVSSIHIVICSVILIGIQINFFKVILQNLSGDIYKLRDGQICSPVCNGLDLLEDLAFLYFQFGALFDWRVIELGLD